MKKLLGIVVLGLLWCNVGFADYYVTGKIQGANKKLLGFATQIVSVDAVGKPGDLYSLQMHYKKVSEYDKKKGRCWIYTELSQVGKVLNFCFEQLCHINYRVRFLMTDAIMFALIYFPSIKTHINCI